MLEHVPHWLGALLKNVRAGHSKLLIAQEALGVGDVMMPLSSPAFPDGGRIPSRFTADGAGISPPLVWNDVPEGTAGLALLVEAPDAPAPSPLVHALVWNLPPDERSLGEGAITRDGAGYSDGRGLGRNSYFGHGWLPPDPPTGHGSHDYVFQLFALSAVPEVGSSPSRSDLAKAIPGKVLAAGVLVGTYSRGEPQHSGTLSAANLKPTTG